MSKKRHQRDPTNGDESSESGDENQNNAECSHINKAVDLPRLKKTLLKSGFLTECEECKKVPADPEIDESEFEVDLSLWLCLKCGNQSCGRSKNMHALHHYETPRSDCHAMCVNTTIWSIWCYGCDNEINISCKKKLLEAVEYLKKHSESNRMKQVANTNTVINKFQSVISTLPETLITNTSSTGALPKTIIPSTTDLPRARGLANLGNTCFFNSVMQCLGQTPYLVKLLDETAESGQHFSLPGGSLKLKDKEEEISLPALEGETERWRPLTQTLAETLHELQSGRPEVYIPRNLLQKLTCRMPQFGGGDQHDSHELLRHLLEAVREEDQRRFKAVILEKLVGSKKIDPATVEEEKKQVVKFYGQQVSEMLLATEQVFRGALVSTLQCQICDHMSHREEKFLDLSLPICDKQVAPILRRKAEDSEDNKPSKHQIKKEKRAERKRNKSKLINHAKVVNKLDNSSNDISMEKKSDNEESDADVEDNVEDSCPPNVIALPAPGEDFTRKGTESGYNSDKVDNGSSDSNRINSPTEINVDDSGIPSPSAVTGGNVGPNSPASSEANVDMGSPLFGTSTNSPDEEFGDGTSTFPRPMSRLAFVENNNNKNIDLKVDLEKLSLLNDGDSSKVNSVFEPDQLIEGACAMETTNSEMMDQDEDYIENDSTYNGTLAPRYQCEEGECSVESCLNQFTECELLMGSNKVGCDLCTKRSGNKKTIYTDASKQLLIYNPPAVLILHLKRFQVCRFRSAKMSKFVKFSTELDLGPFCSKRSQNLPTIQHGQTKVLYSLYGIVEHSGSIHGGHYVAYVKVRKPLEENSYRWQFLPKNQKEKIQELGEVEAPQGKWYYISDSYVSEVPESKVLNAQAYLLFYERLT
ncbi:ubiquitin carboxyl-terminal hydrolase 16 [Anthonomus grandis grandis]|uniref:ubiquitin carboxyl-terminal hydrolase 16 n=1 Tax=Anthonomus grandis grandis TaxID=2921223 RepID=UPI002165CD98|nr:ubiquitin carboxyl-terminal hydrolase 16 [Anthonomus grandis grandis]